MPTRYACLVVPSFVVAAVRRARPDLRERSLAITIGRPPAVSVLEADDRARHLGIHRGLSADDAAARAPDLVLCARDLAAERSAHEALLDVALALSPRVEDVAPGVVCLDLAGLQTLYPSEPRLISELTMRAEGVSLPARAGIAASRTVARLAAIQGVPVIPQGREAAFLSPLPIDVLAPETDLAVVLDRWGIRTLGQLAALPDHALIERLGHEGRRVQRLARGEDLEPLTPFHPSSAWEEGLDLEWPIEQVEPLTFALSGLLDRLAARLAGRGWAVGSVRLTAGLVNGTSKTYSLALASPAADGRVILPLLIQVIEADPAPAAIDHLVVRADPAITRLVQSGLFTPSAASPEQLATTLARLEALVGRERLGSPALLDTHRPDAFTVTPFGARASSTAADHRRVVGAPSPVLRRVRPPLPVEVETTDRGVPTHILGGPWKSAVRVAAGPWRSSGEWWGETAWATDEWDAALASGCVVRLVFHSRRRTWVLDGVYD
jgi:protein ImuB